MKIDTESLESIKIAERREGFLAGAEAMRERAAVSLEKWIIELRYGPVSAAIEIRALPLEGETKEEK
jgi:hypothetical protein